MKIRDIIVETAKQYDDVHDDHKSVFAQAVKFPTITNQYYAMYRMGMDIAGQGDTKLLAKSSAIANNLVMIAYHPKEMEMIKSSAKNLGHPIENVSNSHSHEPDTVNKVSAVRVRKAK